MRTSLRFVLLLAIPALLFTFCEKETSLPVDPLYPTRYFLMHPDSLLKLRVAYHANFPYLTSGLDKFGFYGWDSFPSKDPSSDLLTLTENEAITLAEEFLFFSPITKRSRDWQFKLIDCLDLATNHWYLYTSPQYYDTLEVYNTGLGIRILNNNVTECRGNWYPKMYIPSNPSYDQWKARTRLLNHTVRYSDWTGPKKVIVSTRDLENIWDIHMLIYPLEKNSTIEMRLVWQFKWNIFFAMVDAVTGEIVTDGLTVDF